MKLKSVFSRIPKWLILLVILAAFYFIFRKSVEGFAARSCHSYYKRSTIKDYYGKYPCLPGLNYDFIVPANGYKDSSCTNGGGNPNKPIRNCM
jgi:hypothetical protein